MMLPITAYGHPTLKKKGEKIGKNYPELHMLIGNMFETMYESNGVGLAAQQINRAIRLFIVDASPFEEQHPETKDFKKVFINAYMQNEEGEIWEFEEGCLSVPGINEYVKRKSVINICYYDENFVFYENERFDGIKARIIQHEYDHNQGIMFIERLPNIKRLLLKGKLYDISTGKTKPGYKMLYPRKKTKR